MTRLCCHVFLRLCGSLALLAVSGLVPVWAQEENGPSLSDAAPLAIFAVLVAIIVFRRKRNRKRGPATPEQLAKRRQWMSRRVEHEGGQGDAGDAD